MEMGENWQVNAPWAQLVVSTKVPDKLFKSALEMTDKVYEDVNRDSAGNLLAGQIKNEYFITEEKLIKAGLMKYFIEMSSKYWQTVLNNGNLWQYCDTKFEHGPHGFNYVARIVSAWTVHQFENEYNPIHGHTSCKISAVMSLKFPEKINPPVKEHLAGLDGALIFSGMGNADEWCTVPVMKCGASNTGWLHLFPSSLQHLVYPFGGKGERRSLSFNADIISQKQMDSIALHEKLKQENEKKEI
jgi:hypothetical protein|tara:strand:+ start:1499 stop:2230 length:732 start_codon:yes stop_codon:yes gene_type:complete